MSALDELIYNRTQTDVTYAAELNRKLGRGEALTAQELADWNAGLKGAYNAADMNRVDAAVRELGGLLTAAGYPVEYVDPRKLTSSGAGLPEGYTQVEYIESDGTQYIDTGYKPNNNTRVQCRFELLESGRAYGIFGSRIAYQNTAFDLFAYGQNSHKDFQDDYGSISNAPMASTLGIYEIDKNKNVTNLNGNIYTFPSSTFQSNYNMYILGINTAGSTNNQLGSLKIYSCQIYDNGTLIRDFVPCKTIEGVVGLYDTVNGVFYTTGTGSFTAGADVAPKPETDEWVVGDIINLPVWAQYIQNVRNIIEEYYTMPDSPALPEPTAPLTFDGANAIEKLLYDISQLYDAMVASYRLCGAFKCGSNTQHLPLQRSVI